MFDRAAMAGQSIAGRYDVRVADFTEDMLLKLVREQQVVNAMDTALAEEQFEIWYQPQYNHAENSLIGAEALVRWRKDGVLVQPGSFIPVFERNGFIYELDQYVWEKVCASLRNRLDKGFSPLPVSVNVSRYDLFQEGLADKICALVKRYGLEKSYLRLEVTESAFSESTNTITRVVNELIRRGFTVEIDDFGSGYSSLNTLKDVPAAVIKLDMRFLESTRDAGRGGNIVESVVRMARWLGMAVIAEGVETAPQADYLKSIGCAYVQGFMYARPMPENDYYKLCESSKSESALDRLRTRPPIKNGAIWDPGSLETLVFNSYAGSACVFETCKGKVELLRCNDLFAKEFAISRAPDRVTGEDDILNTLEAGSRDALTNCVISAAGPDRESSCELRTTAGEYIRASVRMLAQTVDRRLFYCTVENITAQVVAEHKRREAEDKEKALAQRFKAMMDNINGSVTVTILKDGAPNVIIVNDRFYEIQGYTKAQYEAECPDRYFPLHPDDRQRIIDAFEKGAVPGNKYSLEYRIVRRDGGVRWIRSNISVIDMPGVDAPVQLAVAADITDLREAEARERASAAKFSAVINNVGSGITASVSTPEGGRIIFANDRFYELTGHDRSKAEYGDIYSMVHPDDRDAIKRAAHQAANGSGHASLRFRLLRPDGSATPVQCIISMCRIPGVEGPVQLAIFNDITAESELDEQLRFLNDSAHDLLSQPDADMAIESSLKRLLQYFNGCRAYVVELDRTRRVSTNTYEICAPGTDSQKDNLRDMPYSCDEPWYKTLLENRFVVVDNLSDPQGEYAAQHDLLESQGINSLALAPLWRDGVLIGFVGVDNPGRGMRHLARMMALGDYIAILLTRRDLDIRIKNDYETTQQLMRDMPGGFCRLALNGDAPPKIAYINDGCCRLLGMSRERILAECGENALNALWPEDIDSSRAGLEAACARGGQFSTRLRLRCGDGSGVWALITSRFNSSGSSMNAYITDITGQMRSEHQRNELLDNLPCGAALYEYDGKKLSVSHINRRYWHLVGRKPVDYARASVFGAIHPDDRQSVQMELEAAIRRMRNVSCDARLLMGDGSYAPFHIAANVVPRREGVYALYTFYMPISQQVMSIQDLLPIALSTMMSTSEDLSCLKDRDLRYICASRSVAQALGIANERELIGKTDFDLYDKDLAAEFRRYDEKILETGRPILNAPGKLKTPDGGAIYISTSKYPVLDPSGSVTGIYTSSRNVTRLRENESQLKLLSDSIPGGLAAFEFTHDRIRRLYCNEGFYDFAGCSRDEFEELTAKDPYALVYGPDREKFAALTRSLMNGETRGDIGEFLFRAVARDGSIRWFSLKGRITETSDDSFILNIVQYDVTEQLRIQEKLRVSEEENRLAIAHSGNIITKFSVANRTLTLPSSLNPIFALPQVLEDMPAGQIALGRVSPETADAYTELFESIVRGTPSGTATFQQNSTKGWRWLEAHFTTIFSDENRPVSAVITFSDVTERLEKEVVYSKWQQSLNDRPDTSYTLLRCNLSKDLPCDSREGGLLGENAPLGEYSFNERARRYAAMGIAEIDRSTYTAFMNSDALLAGYYRGRRSCAIEYREALPDGGTRWLRLTVDLVEYPTSRDVEAYMMYEDIDARKRRELLTLERSETDSLTGLLNRATFISRVSAALSAADSAAAHALMIMDIDFFKSVNDELGHGEGDKALVEAAQAIRAITREGDLSARLGGDEFFVFLQNIPDAHAALERAGQLCALMDKPLRGSLRLSASVGIAVWPKDGQDFDTLYKNADRALYFQKNNRKGRCALYDPSMDETAPD